MVLVIAWFAFFSVMHNPCYTQCTHSHKQVKQHMQATRNICICTHTMHTIYWNEHAHKESWHPGSQSASHCVTGDLVHWELLCQHTTACLQQQQHTQMHTVTHTQTWRLHLLSISIIYKNRLFSAAQQLSHANKGYSFTGTQNVYASTSACMCVFVCAVVGRCGLCTVYPLCLVNNM